MLTPSSSMLSLSRTLPQNLLLTSLELLFKGQTELVLTDISYSPLHLISITKELISASQPIHISESPDEDHAEWHVMCAGRCPGGLKLPSKKLWLNGLAQVLKIVKSKSKPTKSARLAAAQLE